MRRQEENERFWYFQMRKVQELEEKYQNSKAEFAEQLAEKDDEIAMLRAECERLRSQNSGQSSGQT